MKFLLWMFGAFLSVVVFAALAGTVTHYVIDLGGSRRWLVLSAVFLIAGTVSELYCIYRTIWS